MMTRRHLRTALPAILAAAAMLFSVIPVAADEPQVAAPAERATEAIEPAALVSGQLTVVRVTGGLSSPLGVTNAGDGSGRLFVVERSGRVRVVQSGRVTGTFLDLRGPVSAGGERGLLNVAFHPNFETNRLLYVYYTRAGGDIVISRLTANASRTSVPASSEQVLLTIDHSENSNHNGGSMAFGPDGYLYLGTGDGGGAGDPLDNGQDITGELLGKILRIDVNGTGDGPFNRYAIPADNPFVGETGDDEIWAYGVRNPWRISFDRSTHSLFIADVGQGRREEVNRQAASSNGGLNYGWNVMEGTLCYPSGNSCNKTGKVLPAAQYGHDLGCSITGGHVYRGAHRDLQGLYVYGDFCSGRIWTMRENGSGETVRRDTSLSISSFGEGESGELFLTDLNGALYRVMAPEFTDIATSTFIDSIHWLLYEGITAGCGGTRFCPTAAVTRVQMAMFLVRQFNHPPTSTNYFTDDNGITGESSINALRAAGITSGCTATQFCPTRPVTRAQMAIFLDKELNPPDTNTDFFDDDDGKTGESSINRLASAGITGGCAARRYCPTASVTRGQMAAFLRRADAYAP